MAVDWNADGNLMWRDEVRKEQQGYFYSLGTPKWREFEPSHYGILKREIGFALFGVPEEVPCANLNDGTGYRDEKLKEINKIFGIIKKCMKNHTNPNKILVSFLFVSGKEKSVCVRIPVIRIPKFDIVFEQNVNLFIDSYGRVYDGWQDYLENNKIPECVLCYPRNGVYSEVNGAVDVEYEKSAAGRTKAKLLQKADAVATFLSAGATGILIAGMFVQLPPAVVKGAKYVSCSTGTYSAGRNIQTLVDRHQHQQSIGLDSAESWNCWLGIGGGVMSFASGLTMEATVRTAQEGATLSLAGQIAIKSVAVSSCVLNGLAVGNGLANVIEKTRDGKEITALDVFQLASAVLFFTGSVISTHRTMSLINSMGKNSSGGSSGDMKAFMNRIYECVDPTKTCKTVLGFVFKCPLSVFSTAEGRETSLLSVCSTVGRKLIEIARRMLRVMWNCVLEVGELLGQVWESWNKEMDEVMEVICRAFGVKHWSELVAKGCRLIDIRAMASTIITEKRSLEDCGSTAMSSNQRQTISDDSAVVGTDDGSNSVVDGENQRYKFYYDEMANIQAKCVNRQMFRNPADFRRFMMFVCKFVKSQLQEKKSRYEKSWEIVKDFMNVEEFNEKYGISGNPNNHFLQEVFNAFKKEEQDAFTLLHLAYLSENADTSAQEEENGQGFLDADGVRFCPFDGMSGVANSEMPSKQQYCEMATKLMGRRVDTDSIYMSACGDTAVIQVNGSADVIMVQCWPEDGKVSGIAAVLHTPSE